MLKIKKENIRNFSIIAHIDHGKSTLADRLIEYTTKLRPSELKEQMLDTLKSERDRGITIKLNNVRLIYESSHTKEKYLINLIDTPGHIDFKYEVSRSLAACEGALLVIDAAQGIQAQTLANVDLALEHDLAIIPILNKIDLPQAEPERVKTEIKTIIGLDCENAPLISAKNNIGTEEVLESIVAGIPHPKGDENGNVRALIFDSYYDEFKGIVLSICIKDGKMKKGDKLSFFYNKIPFEVREIFVKTPFLEEIDELDTGHVGLIATNIKETGIRLIGDTIFNPKNEITPLIGYKQEKPMVYCSVFPLDTEEYEKLEKVLKKLKLNDDSLTFEATTSTALGSGFRCGFLGMLHLEIIQERILNEYNLEVILTPFSVIYKVNKTNGTQEVIYSPAGMPRAEHILNIEEPYCRITIITPLEYLGLIFDHTVKKHGKLTSQKLIDSNRQMLTFEMPLSELIYGYFDTLKSMTKGYASLNYEVLDYRVSKLCKVDILLNKEPVDALSKIVHTSDAYHYGNDICSTLKEVLPKHNFEIPVQAAIGGKIIARETVKALRKNVLSKCYGGDITRKRKLLDKQKKGKKKMKQIGSVNVSQEVFTNILKIKK